MRKVACSDAFVFCRDLVAAGYESVLTARPSDKLSYLLRVACMSLGLIEAFATSALAQHRPDIVQASRPTVGCKTSRAAHALANYADPRRSDPSWVSFVMRDGRCVNVSTESRWQVRGRSGELTTVAYLGGAAGVPGAVFYIPTADLTTPEPAASALADRGIAPSPPPARSTPSPAPAPARTAEGFVNAAEAWERFRGNTVSWPEQGIIDYHYVKEDGKVFSMSAREASPRTLIPELADVGSYLVRYNNFCVQGAERVHCYTFKNGDGRVRVVVGGGVMPEVTVEPGDAMGLEGKAAANLNMAVAWRKEHEPKPNVVTVEIAPPTLGEMVDPEGHDDRWCVDRSFFTGKVQNVYKFRSREFMGPAIRDCKKGYRMEFGSNNKPPN